MFKILEYIKREIGVLNRRIVFGNKNVEYATLSLVKKMGISLNGVDNESKTRIFLMNLTKPYIDNQFILLNVSTNCNIVEGFFCNLI